MLRSFMGTAHYRFALRVGSMRFDKTGARLRS